eukprot:TRINITY_DN10356_c0_g1_i1.p1 TRINITY_DN10356_c0_g1~~TRINITY_DN10356_c0_g1_i1.p1  ORF type:complete len:545 (+),score=97.89 TRINITY_DN10356_c0_g1_i1:60-1694(+)
MGNPESKPDRDRSVPSAPVKVVPSPSPSVPAEDVPYTAFSISKSASETENAPQPSSAENESKIPASPSKPIVTESPRAPVASGYDAATRQTTPGVIKVRSAAAPQAPEEPELVALRRLPQFYPLLKSSIEKRLFDDDENDEFPTMDPKSLLLIGAEYSEAMMKYAAAVAKHQKEINLQIRNADNSTAKALQLWRQQAADLYTVESYFQQVDGMFANINRINENLSSILSSINMLVSVLPEHLKMEEPLPVPLLTLSHHEHIEKSQIFSKEGMPVSTRGIVWQQSIGNSLGVSRENYAEYLAKMAEKKRQFLLDPDTAKKDELYDLVRLIKVDVPRTFPSLDEICSHFTSTFYEELTQVLEAYIIFKPSVGYAQGMSYVAGMLLLHMDTFEAFMCLANLLNNHFFDSIFKLDTPELSKHFKILDLLFSQHLPELYSHFTVLGILPEQYLLSWYSTVFNQVLPLKLTVMIWDRFLMEGEIFLHRVVVGILKLLNSQLLGAGFEDIIRLLKNINEEIEEKKLFESIETINVPKYLPKIIARIDGLDH